MKIPKDLFADIMIRNNIINSGYVNSLTNEQTDRMYHEIYLKSTSFNYNGVDDYWTAAMKEIESAELKLKMDMIYEAIKL